MRCRGRLLLGHCCRSAFPVRATAMARRADAAPTYSRSIAGQKSVANPERNGRFVIRSARVHVGRGVRQHDHVFERTRTSNPRTIWIATAMIMHHAKYTKFPTSAIRCAILLSGATFGAPNPATMNPTIRNSTTTFAAGSDLRSTALFGMRPFRLR